MDLKVICALQILSENDDCDPVLLTLVFHHSKLSCSAAVVSIVFHCSITFVPYLPPLQVDEWLQSSYERDDKGENGENQVIA